MEGRMMEQHSATSGRTTAWIGLLILLAATIAVVGIPVWILKPFKPQQPQGVEVAYALRRWSPVVTLVTMAVIVALMIRLWRRTRRWWSKTALVVVLLITLAAAWFARQNYFEWMFNPLPEPAYARVSEATFVADTDMVLAVELNGEAVAYPVRQIGYHHVVQDTVGGVPIVATY
jgi:hypothetical protein